jgi:hypothetical protein
MTINVSFEQLKRVGAIALIATNLFTFGVAVSYLRWRHGANPVFARMEFDLNDRLPQIKQRFLAAQAAAAAREAAAAKAAVAPEPTPAPETTPTTAPPAPKK